MLLQSLFFFFLYPLFFYPLDFLPSCLFAFLTSCLLGFLPSYLLDFFPLAGKMAFMSVSRRSFLKLLGAVPVAAWGVGGRHSLLHAFAGDSQMPSKKTARVGLVHSPIYKKHVPHLSHPERPQRLDAIMEALAAPELAALLVAVQPRPATEAEIRLCHSADYVRQAKRDIQSGAETLSTGDTDVCRDSLEAALLAAGGVLAAVDAVVAGAVETAFCALRPPGHHATPDRGMGFCIFNNVAIAARYAQKKHGIARVLIADWDVHHGNGTQETFYEDGSVFFFSTHQSPWYPGTGSAAETGRGAGKGATLNCPFPAGTDGERIVAAFREKLLPVANAFKPELVLISAGFDSRHGDPLGMFHIRDEQFAELTAILRQIAGEHANGKVISVLEGGYSLEGLAAASAAHVRALAR